MIFREQWLEAVKRKNSVLCAGLDPAEFEMRRGDEGLPLGTKKFEWAIQYLQAVAPFAAAVKLNLQYWRDPVDREYLHEIVSLAHESGLVVIDDSKLADIGSTNDAGLYYSKKEGFDAVTVAPFAGNLEEIAKQGKAREIGIITMCLMSNPEYAIEKQKLTLIQLDNSHFYDSGDIVWREEFEHTKSAWVPQYLTLAHDAAEFGIDGIGVGAPSAENHIREEEIAKVRRYAGDSMPVLLPGIGTQGGEASTTWKHFASDKVIVNVGRDLMFPKGPYSTPEDQANKARYYQTTFNSLRTK